MEFQTSGLRIPLIFISTTKVQKIPDIRKLFPNYFPLFFCHKNKAFEHEMHEMYETLEGKKIRTRNTRNVRKI